MPGPRYGTPTTRPSNDVPPRTMTLPTRPTEPPSSVLGDGRLLVSRAARLRRPGGRFGAFGRWTGRRGDDCGARPPGADRLATAGRGADPDHHVHPDPAVHAPRQPAVPARALPRVRRPARPRVARLAARRFADHVQANGIRRPAPGDRGCGVRVDRGESRPRRTRVHIREQEPHVLPELRAGALPGRERDPAARGRRLPREDARHLLEPWSRSPPSSRRARGSTSSTTSLACSPSCTGGRSAAPSSSGSEPGGSASSAPRSIRSHSAPRSSWSCRLAIYLARCHAQRRWIACALALSIGAISTVSRTGIVMFVVIGLVFLWLRPRETRRLWPALVPALIVIHLAVPGTLGSIKNSFMPPGGLVAEQKSQAGQSGSGRLADLGPGIREWKRQPLVGQGFGTRVVESSASTSSNNILDDQWLGTLLETGILGFFGWLWFFARAVRRFGAEAKRDEGARGWLLVSITASVAAYGGRHAHLRRLLVHPGDVPALHPRRARLGPGRRTVGSGDAAGQGAAPARPGSLAGGRCTRRVASVGAGGHSPATTRCLGCSERQQADALLPPEVRAGGLVLQARLAGQRGLRIAPDHRESGGPSASLPERTKDEVPRPVVEVVGGDALVPARPPGASVALAFAAGGGETEAPRTPSCASRVRSP